MDQYTTLNFCRFEGEFREMAFGYFWPQKYQIKVSGNIFRQDDFSIPSLFHLNQFERL
jgi:hypothetical protein